MIRRLFLLLIVLGLTASCSLTSQESLPRITPVSQAPSAAGRPALFPAGRWEFVHAITFHSAHGDKGDALGVLVLDKTKIRCVLMTVEGLTLFAAQAGSSGPPVVSRALPPFDKPGFAKGLLADVRSIFRRPKGRLEYGRLAGGTTVYRYLTSDKVTDILPGQDGCWTMDTYGHRIRTRHITTRSCRIIDKTIIPGDIRLVSDGPAGYRLDLHLISAKKMKAAH